MNKETAITLIKNLATEARAKWSILDGLASAQQIKDNQNRITHDEQELIQYIENTAAKEEKNKIINHDCHVELHEQHTERLLYRSEGMSYNEAREKKRMLDKNVGDDIYVYIAVDW